MGPNLLTFTKGILNQKLPFFMQHIKMYLSKVRWNLSHSDYWNSKIKGKPYFQKIFSDIEDLIGQRRNRICNSKRKTFNKLSEWIYKFKGVFRTMSDIYHATSCENS